MAPTYYAQPGVSPYYAPPAGAASVHRFSNIAIIAIVAAAVLVVGAVGGIVAFAHNGSHTPSPVPPSPPAITAQPTPPPQPTAPPQPTQSGFPTSAPTAEPTAEPSSPPLPPAGNAVNAGFATIPIPDGFKVAHQDSGSVELDPANPPGQIFVQAVTVQQAMTNTEIAQVISTKLDSPSTGWPDAQPCNSNGAQQGSLTGTGGPLPAVIVAICGDYTPENGQAFAATDLYIASSATASDGSHVIDIIELFAPKDVAQQFLSSIPNAFFTAVTFNSTAAQ